MAKSLSIQPYTLREQIKVDGQLPVFERLRKIGFVGVEVGDLGGDPAKFAASLSDIGLRASSWFSALPEPAEIAATIEGAQAIGVTDLVAGFWTQEFDSVAAIEATAARVNPVLEALEGSGLKLCLHNHWFEFAEVEGQFAMDRLLALCPGLNLELDIYWAAHFGDNDPVAITRDRKAKIPLMHVKDGPLVQGQAHLPVGEGNVDIRGVIEAADPDVLNWLILELDEYDGDMWYAVEASYKYLTENGLATGQH